ncbi:MAG: hypothetical protein DRI56_05955 [Chloroflexota bacterium]|nr:MAG: hypothetical protein DRI56_05955 [Chloroflexota bacterium]
MAAAQKSIINRIQGYKSRIAGMLKPGSKRPDSQSAARLSPVSAQFGGEKFKLAAKKMRFLNADKMGRSQTEARKNFVEAIPAKFRDTKKMIHVSPGFSRDVSIWSELEKTLPEQRSGQFETPPQAGELRQGSIIQKFSMFPQPGQSNESFKKQAQSIPKPKKRKTPTPPPKLAPKSRMFARIQEVTDHDQANEEIPLEIPETPEESQIEAPINTDNIQRQPDSQPIAELPDLDTPLDQDVIEPPAPVDDLAPPPEPQLKMAEPAKKDRLEKPVLRQLPKAKPAPKKAKTPPSGTPLLRAKPSLPARQIVQRKPDKPAPQKTLKLALPPQLHPVSEPETQEDTPTQALRPELKADAPPRTPRPKPVADAPPPAIRPKSEVDALAQALPPKPAADAPPPAIRPKSEVDAPPPAIRPKSEEEPPPRILRSEPKKEPPPQASPLKPTEEEVPEIPPLERQEEIPQPSRPEPKDSVLRALRPEALTPTTSPEMTLRKRVESHKRVGQAIKALRPEKLVHRVAPPIQTKREHPLISSDKYQPAPKKTDVPESPAEDAFAGFIKSPPQLELDLARHSRPESVAESQPQPEDSLAKPISAAPSALTEALPMALAHAHLPGQAVSPASPPPANVPGLTTPQPPVDLPLTEEEQLPQPPPVPEQGVAIVQNFGEDDIAPSDDGVVRRKAEEDEISSSKGFEKIKLNLDQLAEDVLPLVKRILEIESERLSSNLR